MIDNMSETSTPVPTDFSQLSKTEQVRYVQALWDLISEQPEEIPLWESHLPLVEERLRHHRENPSSARPAFDVINGLIKNRK